MSILAKFCYSGWAQLVVLTWCEGWGGCNGLCREAAGSKSPLDVIQSCEMLMPQGWVQRVLRHTPGCPSAIKVVCPALPQLSGAPWWFILATESHLIIQSHPVHEKWLSKYGDQRHGLFAAPRTTFKVRASQDELELLTGQLPLQADLLSAPSCIVLAPFQR